MVAGHLRVQNGVYQMILSYKDLNGRRKTKSISTGLKEKGNARKAERMLQATRQEFTAPDMAVEYGKDVSVSDLENNIVLTEQPSLEKQISTESLQIQTNISTDITTAPKKLSEGDTNA